LLKKVPDSSFPARHLHRLFKRPEQPEQRSLFALPIIFAGDEFTGSAAQGTKLQYLAADAAQRMDAGITEAFLALGAPAPGAGVRMVQTWHGTVSQQRRRGGCPDIKLRDGHHNRCGLEDHRDFSQVQGLTRFELRFLDLAAVDESPVRRTAVPDEDRALLANNLTMRGRNRCVLDWKIVRAATPKAIHPRPQLY